MVNTTAKICLVIFSALSLAAAACGTGPRNAERMVAVRYPEPRYQVHLRNADRWVKLIEKGRLTSLDNPEVRARASRYGNPDQLLTEDWRPEIPGINAPGDYLKDYAPDPWRTVKDVIDRVLGGKYEHFFPTTEH